jgi:hypothetical protein
MKPSHESVAGSTKQDAELSDADLAAVSGGAGLDGISYLVQVTQMKANDANNASLQTVAAKQTKSLK